MRKRLLPVAICAILCAAILIGWYAGRRPAPSTPVRDDAQPREDRGKINAPPPPEAVRFAREGKAGALTIALERILDEGRARVAMTSRGDARWVCALIDAEKRYAGLDGGLRVGDVPVLKEQGFSEPPLPVAKTMSIYRSHAKTAIDYRRKRGDLVVVLLCPKAEWEQLRLNWDRILGAGDDGSDSP